MRSRSRYTIFLVAVLLSVIWLTFFRSPTFYSTPTTQREYEPSIRPADDDGDAGRRQQQQQQQQSTREKEGLLTGGETDWGLGKETLQDHGSFTNDPIKKYVAAIMNPADTSFERMECPGKIGRRYEGLKENPEGDPRYLIALDLFNVEKILPRLMGSIVQAVRYLGPRNCVISVVEGRSTDATFPILKMLQIQMEALGTEFHLVQDEVDPHAEGVDRIQALAELRNLAVAPLTQHRHRFASDARIVFVNDVALCVEDMLELLYQNYHQSARQTCAMDWIHDGDLFYDVWVSRTLNSGNLFFEIPQVADWKFSDNLFWDDPATRDKFSRLQPFEVFACWGGMVVLDPTPFTPSSSSEDDDENTTTTSSVGVSVEEPVKFRASQPGECYMGEPTLLGKDLWRWSRRNSQRPGAAVATGGRIAIIPTVNLGYSDVETSKIKKRRGYVNELIDTDLPSSNSQVESISWSIDPPGHVKCVGIMWDDPTWVDALAMPSR